MYSADTPSRIIVLYHALHPQLNQSARPADQEEQDWPGKIREDMYVIDTNII
jgi:hypothetical protein